METDKYTIKLTPSAEASWSLLDPIYLGNIPRGLGTPDIFGLVTKNNEPLLYLWIYFKELNLVKAVIWKQWVIVLCEKTVYFLSLQSKARQEQYLGWFGGNFYPQQDVLLVTTHNSVLCFNENAKLLWKTNGLAEEMLTIEKVENNIIKGHGRWEQPNVIDYDTYNPADELETFELNLQNGIRLK